MNQIKIDLQYCYGIKKIDYTFDFTSNRTYAIYAPNGVMKTSFAKTFMDLSNGKPSEDSIFKNRETNRIVTDETGSEIPPDNVFVIVPYDKNYKSKRMSTLLVNKALKEKYEFIHNNIDEKKEQLLKELKPLTGIKNSIDEEFSKDFTHSPKEFFRALLRVKNEVLDKKDPELVGIVYNEIFNEKALAFLNTSDFKTKIKDYIDKYNELIDASTYFKKGVFNHNNATTIAKNLKDNGFFKAKHSVSLNATSSNKVITTEAELEQVIKEEKDSILNNPELAKTFEAIDKKIIANQELRNLRDYLENNPSVLPELGNLELLKQKLWVSYMKQSIESYKQLEEEYSRGLSEIEKIVTQAKKEETQWREVIDEFNKRFTVPFKLSVDNQDDVILKSEGPNIKFIFNDLEDSATIEESELFKVLSNGELRALYILNIIFEVEARKQSQQETLFIIDDIADSFDYKNKYAIIEYLKDISKEPYFKEIILTHNFDFYRTISSRLDMPREHKLHTSKSSDGIKLIQEKYQKNPFLTWKDNFHKTGEEAMLIAAIPFVRNIAEYSGDSINELKLTSLLHIKSDTNSITILDLQEIYKSVLVDKSALVLINPTNRVIDLIYSIADTIEIDISDDIDLEKKVVIAIAIRLKAEQFMIREISNPTFVNAITKNQTFTLFNEYKRLFPVKIAEIKLIEQVNLMTPENIHLNSFMYEPILDMSNEHLRLLYKTIKSI